MAAGAGFDTHAWQLAWSLTTFLLRLGRWDDQLLAQDIARPPRAAAMTWPTRRRPGTHRARLRPLGQFDEANPYFRDALRRFGTLGDQVGQARLHAAWPG